jgi:hypothetical protein
MLIADFGLAFPAVEQGFENVSGFCNRTGDSAQFLLFVI